MRCFMTNEVWFRMISSVALLCSLGAVPFARGPWIEMRRAHYSVFYQAGFEEDRSEKELILTPSMYDWMVWRKIEVFEVVLIDELRNGPRSDGFLMLAFGAIKADLLGLGIGSGGEAQ